MKITALKRKEHGTGASRQLRNAGKTPGIVYGGSDDPVNILLDHNMLYHSLKKENFQSSILDLEVDGKIEQVLLREFQIHAHKQLVLHIDFQRVDIKKIVHVKVPLRFMNADMAPAVKISNAIISHVFSDLEIACLPKDLPEYIEVDLANIQIGDSVHVADLKLPKGVTVVTNENLTIATTASSSDSQSEINASV
jgi:large subunit ribosomal protein L25